MRINNLKKNNILKEEPKEIKSLNWFDKNKFKEILAMTATNLITKIKQVDLSIFTLETWLII